jgi:hypothetical protein
MTLNKTAKLHLQLTKLKRKRQRIVHFDTHMKKINPMKIGNLHQREPSRMTEA